MERGAKPETPIPFAPKSGAKSAGLKGAKSSEYNDGSMLGVKGTVEKVTFIESQGGKVATVRTPDGRIMYSEHFRKPRGMAVDTLRAKDE